MFKAKLYSGCCMHTALSSTNAICHTACSISPRIEHVCGAAFWNNDTSQIRCRIAILGIAFLIATITQLQAAFTRNFHYEMKEDLPTWFTWVLIVTGYPLYPSCKVAVFHMPSRNSVSKT